MRDEVVRQIGVDIAMRRPARLLEFGAGTGLLTMRIIEIAGVSLDVLDIDHACYLELRANLAGTRAKVIQGDICSHRPVRRYDIITSTFAHDHIAYDQRHALAQNLAANLTPGGTYVMGTEILPSFGNERERRAALHAYHNLIIDKAIEAGHDDLARLEHQALLSGLESIGDFKRDEHMLEKEMCDAGFEISSKSKIGPLDRDNCGGVYVYAFGKRGRPR